MAYCVGSKLRWYPISVRARAPHEHELDEELDEDDEEDDEELLSPGHATYRIEYAPELLELELLLVDWP